MGLRRMGNPRGILAMCLSRISTLLVLTAALFIAAAAYGTPTDPGQSTLAEARKELRISEATEARIAAELQKLRDSGEASPDVIRDYEAYLDRVRHMVAIQRQIVADMEEAYSKHASSRPATTQTSSSAQQSPDSELPDEDQYDKLGHLDREFDDSLAAFDDMLLREMEAIRIQKAEEMRDLAEEAAAAAQRLRDKGVDVDTTSPGAEEETGKAGEGGGESQTDAREAGEGSGEEQGCTQTAQGGQQEGGMTPEGGTAQSGTTPPQGGQGGSKGEGGGKEQAQAGQTQVYDDDIVARQLREAAERETDPELKKKLWKEYEDYKRGTAKQDEKGN